SLNRPIIPELGDSNLGLPATIIPELRDPVTKRLNQKREPRETQSQSLWIARRRERRKANQVRLVHYRHQKRLGAAASPMIGNRRPATSTSPGARACRNRTSKTKLAGSTITGLRPTGHRQSKEIGPRPGAIGCATQSNFVNATPHANGLATATDDEHRRTSPTHWKLPAPTSLPTKHDGERTNERHDPLRSKQLVGSAKRTTVTAAGTSVARSHGTDYRSVGNAQSASMAQ